MTAFGTNLQTTAATAAIGTVDGHAAYVSTLTSGGTAAEAAAAAVATPAGGAAAKTAVLTTYHGGLVPPVCTIAARTFFQQY